MSKISISFPPLLRAPYSRVNWRETRRGREREKKKPSSAILPSLRLIHRSSPSTHALRNGRIEGDILYPRTDGTASIISGERREGGRRRRGAEEEEEENGEGGGGERRLQISMLNNRDPSLARALLHAVLLSSPSPCRRRSGVPLPWRVSISTCRTAYHGLSPVGFSFLVPAEADAREKLVILRPKSPPGYSLCADRR